MLTSMVATTGPPTAKASGHVVLEVRVSSGADDVEESDTGSMNSSSSDLELVYGGSRGNQVVGMRFNGVAVPPGAQIENAYLQFQTDETSSDPTTLTIRAEASDNATPFGGGDWDVSSRLTTASSVAWTPPPWSLVGEAGVDQRSPAITALIQEVVARPGWVSGNSMVLIIDGTGERVAEAYDGDPSGAPLLHIEYSTGVNVEAIDDLATEASFASDTGVFRITRPQPFDEALTVDYAVGGSAIDGSDYVSLPGSVDIPAGEGSVDVVVDPLDDSVVEGTETVVLTVLDGSGYTAGSSDTATVSILDDDTPTISISATDDLAVEGAEPANEAVFTFTRTGPTDQGLSVQYTTGGDAIPGSDYPTLPGSVSIPSGAVSASVVVSPLEDTISEPPETATLSVISGTGYAVGTPNTATSTILDNDPIEDLRINSSADDAEESAGGSVDLTSSDLELVNDMSSGDQTVGLRFAINAPQGSTITSAWIQFQANEVDTGQANLVIEGEAADDAPTFADVSFGISSRQRTTQSVPWSPPAWPTKREAGLDQRTPDISAIFQEIVDRPGWASGNSVAVLITGSGRRVAEAFDGDPGAAPLLHIEYSGIGTPTNSPPVVTASSESVVYPDAALVDGTVSDDRLPDPPGAVTVTWSKVSGPGTVTFANPNAEDTTATFSQPGVYELRLSADDGDLTGSDSVLLTAVDPATGQPSQFRAVAFGDYGVGCCGQANVAAMVSALDPDIIITTGDNRYINDIDYAVGQFYADYIGAYKGSYGPGSAINRFFPAPGNHDYSEVGGIDVYLDYFTLPGGAIETGGTSGNERYYDFVYGPVHFFVINSDSEEPDGRDSNSVQAQWLQTQLAASQLPWQIVYMHHPPYSTGGSHGSEPEMQWPYDAWGADAVLAGHDHLYERILKGSFPYFVVGNGGAGIYPANANTEPGSQFIYDADHGAMVIDACAASLTFEFHSVSEGLLDSHTLGAPDCGTVSAPVAANDTDTTPEDTPVVTDVTANDTDPDGDLDPATVSVTTAPISGTAIPNGDGTVTYTPNADSNGTDTYMYEVCDTGGLCDTATVMITVNPFPDPPVANDDTATTNEDTPVNIDVSDNDTDPDGDLDPATVSVTTPPTSGTATPIADGTVTYTPNSGASGTDTFIYQICDATALCATALVTVTVGPVNDPPTAQDDSVPTDEDSPATFDAAANDTDPEGAIDRTSTNTACVGCSETSIGTLTNHGDGTFTYSPDPDFNGVDGFTYEICDTGGLCDTATVTITVNPVPDPPVANDDVATTTEDSEVSIAVLANDGDPDGDALYITNLTQPANGTASIQPNETINYTPDPDFSGIDTLTYTANDGTTDSAPATVTVTVNPVNDPPVATDDGDITDEDTAINTAVLTNDTDPEGDLDPATTSVTGAPTNGSATAQPDGSITYTPNPDSNGTDTYIYEVCDTGGLCDTATVTITVIPVPDPPVAGDDTATTSEDTAVNIDVLANDTDPDGDLDGSTLQVTLPAASGSTVIEPDDTITYTPDPGISGTDSFTYQICDTTALCDTSVVSITISSSETVVEQFAVSETTIEGSLSGSLSDTFATDGLYEEIVEAHSGGPRSSRQSFAEHHWTFSIQRGDSIEVTAEAYHTVNGESDDFEFQYSTDGGFTFQPLFTVTATGNPSSYTSPLPQVISGEVIVRAIDTDRTPGNGATDTLFVDHLVIRTTNPQAPLPVVTVTAPDDAASESGEDATFVISRDDTGGPLTVGFSLGGTATETSDYAPLGSSVLFADGQAEVTLVVDAVDDGVAEGDESVELTLSPGSTYQRGSPSLAIVTIADNNVAGTEARAITETTQSGTVVSGDLTSTHFADGDSEVIDEELYAGNKRSRLEHTWTFNVSAGSSVTFHLLANRIGTESFTFAYSTDGGGSWTPIPVGASGGSETAALPGSVQGPVLVRVTDDDRGRNEATIDRILIDEMYFLSSP